jgi:serine/threonine-protein kinase
MDPQRWERVRALFERLVELPVEARAAALAEAAGGDRELHEAVSRMLAADAETDADARIAPPMPLLEDLVAAEDDDATAELVGRQIGRWRLTRPLGRGGMGSVWLGARSDAGFAQQAAIKLIRGLHPGREAIARFAAEQRILARLSHPNIARLIDGGIADDGGPFIAMEYVDGTAIDAHIAEAGLDLRATLALFLEVCAAVAHAHAQLIVHRDLKPSNILVGRDGGVRLLDFGIAKLVGGLDEAEAGLTTTGVRLYTPGYAAPEQLRGEAVGTATDIWALGALLYELVCGRRPYEVASRSPADWERAVLAAEPAPPSRTAEAARRDAGGAAARRAIPGAWRADLDAIVLKALRREPERRYASVGDLAADLRALLDGRPVGARRGSRRYRMAKFVRRHAIAVAASVAVATALVAGLGTALWQARIAATERDRALAESQRANAALAFQREIFRRARPDSHLGKEPTASDLLDVGERLLGDNTGLDRGVRAALLEELSHSRAALGGFERAYALAADAQAIHTAAGDPRAALRLDIHLAAMASQLSRPDEARERIDRVLAAPPEQALPPEEVYAAWFQHGIQIGNAGDREGAVRAITTAIGLAARTDVARPVRPTAVIGMEVVRAGYLSGSGRAEEALTGIAATRERLAGLGVLDDAGRQQLLQAEGFALELLGRYAEAQRVIEQRLELSTRIYGAQHYHVGQDLTQLARLAIQQGDPALALRHGEAALSILAGQFGPGDPWLSGLRNTLALARMRSGDLEAAQVDANAAYEGRKAQHGDNAVRTLSVRATLAMIEEAAGRTDAAQRIAADIRAAAGDGWTRIAADIRARIDAIRVFHAAPSAPTRCDELAALRDAADAVDAAPLLGLYLAACRRQAGDAGAARDLLAALGSDRLDRLALDPALARLRDIAAR